MTAVAATDFFLALCARTGEHWDREVDALVVGQALGLLAPTIFAHVDELKQRGWIEESPVLSWGQLNVRVTMTGAGRCASEQRRHSGIRRRPTGL